MLYCERIFALYTVLGGVFIFLQENTPLLDLHMSVPVLVPIERPINVLEINSVTLTVPVSVSFF
jgi:hypothetical protein